MHRLQTSRRQPISVSTTRNGAGTRPVTKRFRHSRSTSAATPPGRSTGALQIYLRHDEDVQQGSGSISSGTSYAITIGQSGAVDFKAFGSEGAESFDSSGNRSLAWGETELELNDTEAGTVATVTQWDGTAYDARGGSVDRSTDVKVTEVLDGAGASTNSNAAVQVLAASIQRFSGHNASQVTSKSGYAPTQNASVGPSAVETPPESASALIKTLVFA